MTNSCLNSDGEKEWFKAAFYNRRLALRVSIGGQVVGVEQATSYALKSKLRFRT